LTAAAIITPTIALKSRFFVDVDANPGIDYGASVRCHAELGRFPGGDRAGLVDVETQIDTQAFYRLIIDRLGR
jgi:inosine-uridine nucleoside N-ribohydrolase